MAWSIVYYAARDRSAPAVDFLDGCPVKVAANLLAVLDAVAEAPPPQYSGGGKWEAMHGSMGGFYEVRATGPQREQFRLFCLLENAEPYELARRGLDGPAIAVVAGLRKPWRTTFGERDGVARSPHGEVPAVEADERGGAEAFGDRTTEASTAASGTSAKGSRRAPPSDRDPRRPPIRR